MGDSSKVSLLIRMGHRADKKEPCEARFQTSLGGIEPSTSP